MDFDFSEEQQMLRDSVAKWVDKAYDFARRRRIEREGGCSHEAWRELAGLGLTGLVVPEAHGGLGFGPVEAMVVMEELGRGLVLEPFMHAALVAPRLLAAYAIGLAGDVAFEHGQSTTLLYPTYALICDFLAWIQWVTGVTITL